jgi:hypothetical protein
MKSCLTRDKYRISKELIKQAQLPAKFRIEKVFFFLTATWLYLSFLELAWSKELSNHLLSYYVGPVPCLLL